MSSLQWEGARPKDKGLISGRNAFLIIAALMEKPLSVSIITTGIHSGTGYADCTGEFLEKMQAVLNTYEEARVQLATPFLDWTKADVIKYCLMRGIPVNLTYSCERGLTPCGNCLSCKDRKFIDARAQD